MLTIYKSPRKKSDSSDSDNSTIIIPAGRPYLTKVKGKLVMAREKRDKPADIVLDLLGEAFGANKTKVIQRSRAISLETPARKLLIGGVPCVPQQLTYSTPIPQQPFTQSFPPYPSGFMPVPPQYQSQLQYPLQPQSYVVPPPTEQDLDQLRLMNKHFEDMNNKVSVTHGLDRKEELTKTAITITKHVCAQCGRLRSRKYHHENPIKVGEAPEPAYCRKCQRDASSTSGGESDREPRNPKDKKANKKDKNKEKGKTFKKAVEISDNDDDKESKCGHDHSSAQERPKDKYLSKGKGKAKTHGLVSSDNYIIIEEERSEIEQALRGRGRTRVQERVVLEEYVNQRPQSSLEIRCSARNQSPLQFSSRAQRSELPQTTGLSSKNKAPRRSSPPPIYYRYVERVPSHEFVDIYPKEVAMHFEGKEEFYTSNPKRDESPEAVQHSQCSPLSEQFTVEVIEELEAIDPNIPNTHHRSKDIATSSRRTSHNRERRNQERKNGQASHSNYHGPLYEVHSRYKKEASVETKKSEYRPQDNRDYEEERRVQEHLDREILNARGGSGRPHNGHVKNDCRHLGEDSDHRYYHEDWSRVESEKSRRSGYQGDRHLKSDISDTEASLLYDKNGIYGSHYPRVPSPPSVISVRGPLRPPYPLSSDSDGQNTRTRPHSPTLSKDRSVILSSRGYSNQSYGSGHENESRKHVTFRNTLSERSTSEPNDGWRIEDPEDLEPIHFPSETGWGNRDPDEINSWVEGGTNLWSEL